MVVETAEKMVEEDGVHGDVFQDNQYGKNVIDWGKNEDFRVAIIFWSFFIVLGGDESHLGAHSEVGNPQV